MPIDLSEHLPSSNAPLTTVLPLFKAGGGQWVYHFFGSVPDLSTFLEQTVTTVVSKPTPLLRFRRFQVLRIRPRALQTQRSGILRLLPMDLVRAIPDPEPWIEMRRPLASG